jgi:MoxR-like ATPase/intein/homing endonuclease
MRDEIRKIQELMETAEYVTDAPVATSVHLSQRLRKPLLIEGPAGVGKTEVAKVMARMLRTNLIRLQCYEGLDASTALYEWNYQKQLLHIKLHETSGRSASDEEREIFSEAFLLRRPLLQAISQSDQAPVLLVDEVDRCVTARTLIATTSGIKTADRVQAGDDVVSFDPSEFRMTRSTVKKVIPRAAAAIRRIYAGGRVLEVTPEHKFARHVDGCFEIVEASRLSAGDLLPLHKSFYAGQLSDPDVAIDDEMVKLSIRAKEMLHSAYKAAGKTYETLAAASGVSRSHLRNVIGPISCRQSLRRGTLNALARELGVEEKWVGAELGATGFDVRPSVPFYEILGYVVADGCFTSDRLAISDKDFANLQLYADKFSYAFGRRARIVKGPHRNFELTCHSLPLGRFLRRLLGRGMVRSRQREVPEFVFALSADNRAAFIRGFFDGEGWVGDHQVCATSSSLYLLIGVQWLLSSVGVDSHIRRAAPTGFHNHQNRDYYTITISAPKRFRDAVGFNSAAKRTKLDVLAERRQPSGSRTELLPRKEVVPVLEGLAESQTLHAMPGHQTIYDVIAGRVKPNAVTVGRLAASFDSRQLNELAERDVVLAEVTSIEDVPGEHMVYDFVLDGTPYFVANQVVTHNCDEEFEAFMLEVFSDWQVTIPEIGTIKATHPPYVILTSNRTRELSDALRRRCLYLWIDYPTYDKEIRIVERKVPGINHRLADEVTRFMESLRRMRLAKVPGVAETLDWAHALAGLHADHLDEALVSETIGCVLKDADDIKRFRAEMQKSGVASFLQVSP